MKKPTYILSCLTVILLIVFLPLWCEAGELTINPSLRLRGEYDDNIDFDPKDETGDWGGYVIPKMTLDYATELLKVSLFGEVDVLKYLDETTFDRTNVLTGMDGSYRMSPRWILKGDFEFRRDETIDSQLEETGQATDRSRVKTYDGGGGLFYQITELSDIGFDVDYRKRDYNSDDNVDFDRYTFSLPYTKRFANQRDTLGFIPAYTIFDSDAEDANDYSFAVEWKRRISETLNSEVMVGGRYTDIDENQNNGNDDNLGVFGKLALSKTTETFSGEIGLSRDLRANSDGQILTVNQAFLRFDKRFLERLGFRFDGSGYISDTESGNAGGDKVRFFEAKPELYYMLTENHSVILTYNYQNKKEFDEPGDPETQRNRVSLGFEFNFPKKWN
jgi:hypothetical protein